MKPCPFCGEQIQDAAVKCRFCFEWLDPSKRPSRSDEPFQGERAEPGPPAHALHEVARAAAAPQPRAEPTHPNREISQAKPIGSFLDRGRPAPGSVGPDERGRAGGVLQVGEPPASPAVTPRFQAPGGEPPARPRPEWQPAQTAGPGAWRPVEPEPEPPAQAQAAAEPPAGVWTPPTWLMEESRPAPESTARMPVGPALTSPPVDPAWGPPAAATSPPATPAWVAPDHTWTPATHPPAAAPALANTSDDEFEDVPVGPAVAHERARLEPVAVRPAPATGPTAAPAAGTPEPTRGPRRRERIHVALEDEVPQAERPSDPPSSPAPVATAPTPAPVKAKPHHDDDDDDDFGDDFGDDDDAEASSGMSGGGMSTIARPSRRKFPWLPVAAVSGVLVLVLGFVFQDELLGIADETPEEVEAGVDSAAEPEPTAPEPEPTPVEPKPQDPPTTGAPEPPPVEPPPPAIDPVELAAKLAEADAFYQKAKHEKAREVLDAILAKSPREPGALALLAQVLLETSDFETALATANLCIGADPTQPNCWITIAVVEQQNKNLPRALEGYRKYLEAAPDGRFAKDAKKQITRLAKEVEG